MTSDLGSDDVVVHITAPQTISAEGGAGAGAGAGARVSAGAELGRRLLLAARAGDTPLVLDLMAKGAPFTTDWLGTSALHLAAAAAHAGTVGVLLRAGVSRDARTKTERAPLHVAAAAGHAAVVRVLLAAGAAVDCRDMLRMTPLHWAVQRGHAAAAAELLAHGADPAATSKFHKTPRALALQLRRPDLLRLLDDAQRDREARPHPPGEPRETQNVKTYKIKTEKEKLPKIENTCEGAGEGAAAQLLRKHGITLLPADHSSTVLSALQSGRTVVLSDAGKLMLKESTESGESAGGGPPAASPPPAGMVLTATPVKAPPKPGIKIFTLNNKLIAKPKEVHKIPVKKIINPQDMQQVKLVAGPGRPGGLAAPGGLTAPGGLAGSGGRPALKIIVNKAKVARLVTPQGGAGAGAGEAAALRAALAASRRALAALAAELRATRARLARYEGGGGDAPPASDTPSV